MNGNLLLQINILSVFEDGLLSSIGDIPPREYEENYYRQTEYQKAA